MSELRVYTPKLTVAVPSHQHTDGPPPHHVEQLLQDDAVDLLVAHGTTICARIGVTDRPAHVAYLKTSAGENPFTRVTQALQTLETSELAVAGTADTPTWYGWVHVLATVDPADPDQIDIDAVRAAATESSPPPMIGFPDKTAALRACKALAGPQLAVAVGRPTDPTAIGADLVLTHGTAASAWKPLNQSAADLLVSGQSGDTGPVSHPDGQPPANSHQRQSPSGWSAQATRTLGRLSTLGTPIRQVATAAGRLLTDALPRVGPLADRTAGKRHANSLTATVDVVATANHIPIAERIQALRRMHRSLRTEMSVATIPQRLLRTHHPTPTASHTDRHPDQDSSTTSEDRPHRTSDATGDATHEPQPNPATLSAPADPAYQATAANQPSGTTIDPRLEESVDEFRRLLDSLADADLRRPTYWRVLRHVQTALQSHRSDLETRYLTETVTAAAREFDAALQTAAKTTDSTLTDVLHAANGTVPSYVQPPRRWTRRLRFGLAAAITALVGAGLALTVTTLL